MNHTATIDERKPKFPSQLRLDLTNRCNQACVFCPFHGLQRDRPPVSHLPLETYQRLVSQLAELPWKPRVRFVGSGEPTLYPWFREVALLLYQNGHSLKLITNGQFGQETAEVLAGMFAEIVFSVHGPAPVHDRLTRHPGAFERLLRNVAWLRKNNETLGITLHMVINERNVDHLEAHARLAADLGVSARYQHMFWRPEGSGLDHLDPIELGASLRQLQRRHPGVQVVPALSEEEYLRYYDFSKPFRRKEFRCTKLRSDLGIRYDGEVSVCGGPAIGDINTDNIASILQGDQRLAFINDVLEKARSPEGPPLACSRCCHN